MKDKRFLCQVRSHFWRQPKVSIGENITKSKQQHLCDLNLEKKNGIVEVWCEKRAKVEYYYYNESGPLSQAVSSFCARIALCTLNGGDLKWLLRHKNALTTTSSVSRSGLLERNGRKTSRSLAMQSGAIEH